MSTASNVDLCSSSAIIIQPSTHSQTESSTSNVLIVRLGWTSFALGACAFIIHCISLSRLATLSSINAGIISGFFLMISGLASASAGRRKISYGCFIHAQIWSLIVSILFIPGILAVSIAALILDSEVNDPLCQQLPSPSRTIFFDNNLEIYPSNIQCLHASHSLNITQTLNSIQLIIAIACFFVQIVLLSLQRKGLRRTKTNTNDLEQNVNQSLPPGKIIVYTRPVILDASDHTNETSLYLDPPPKYDDLPRLPD